MSGSVAAIEPLDLFKNEHYLEFNDERDGPSGICPAVSRGGSGEPCDHTPTSRNPRYNSALGHLQQHIPPAEKPTRGSVAFEFDPVDATIGQPISADRECVETFSDLENGEST